MGILQVLNYFCGVIAEGLGSFSFSQKLISHTALANSPWKDVPLEKAVARQWHMLEEHAARLRPDELFPKWGSLELWLAPGDSEIDVAYNRDIQFIQMFRSVGDGDITTQVRNVEIGFQGEVYENGEDGFRTVRTADGKPAKPEIQGSEQNQQPTTEAELEKMMEILESQAMPDE